MTEAWVTIEFDSPMRAVEWLESARTTGDQVMLNDELVIVARVVGGLENAIRDYTEIAADEPNEIEETPMTEYVKFTERNDHEGETWVFWLRLEGNEAQLERLAELVELYGPEDEDSGFELSLETRLDAHDVGVLVTHGGGGYMPYHTKVDGRLVVPEESIEGEALTHVLYKGGIKMLFQLYADRENAR